MSNNAPKPPTKKLLLGAGLSTGTTIGIWAITIVGEFVYTGGIPSNRLTVYIGAGLAGIAVSGWLGTRYLLQKQRRDAWWDGFAAGDEPLAEVIPLRDLKGSDDAAREFRTNSPS